MTTIGQRTVGLGTHGRDGVLVGGAAESAPKLVRAQLGDLGIAFNGGKDLEHREVALTLPNGESRSFELASGKNRSIASFGGHKIEQRDDQLFVDGQRVDFGKLEAGVQAAGQKQEQKSRFDETRFQDSIAKTHQQLAEGIGRLDQAVGQAIGQVHQYPGPQSAAALANVLRSVANDVQQALPGEAKAAKKLAGLAKDAEGLVAKSADAKARQKLTELGDQARAELHGIGGRLGSLRAEAQGIDKGSFDAYVQTVLAQMGVPKGATVPPSHAEINSAYDPRMAAPQAGQPYGGVQMDPRMFGAYPPGPPLTTGGIVAPEPDISGLGKAALIGAAATLLLRGVGPFGYPMYGMGMGWPNSGLGMGSFNWNVW
ncbi:MAG: hypothetical protein HYV07_09620 [Deltaproteobacteria bacterium]|nr:hypothetical protein [Deltaproteobacteria bacterium]